MRNLILTLISSLMLTSAAFGQFDVTINVTDLNSGLPLSGATVSLNGGINSTNGSGDALFPGINDGTYSYNVSLDCYEGNTGSVTVSGGNITDNITLDPITINDVFFFLTEAGGPPFTLSGATVTLTDGNGFNESIVTGNPVGDLFEAVPYGDYTYTISKDCFVTGTGAVTVDCAGGVGVSVFTSIAANASNDVFFFLTEAGGPPFTLSGATVTLTDGNGFNESIVTGNPVGDLFEAVPYGDYTYTISKNCFVTGTGAVTVDCAGGVGTSVFTSIAANSSNDVFFFLTEAGGPPFTLSGATVTLTDGGTYNESIVTGNPVGDLFEAVPYGDYTYTITKECFETGTGAITVDCAGGVGTSVFTSIAAGAFPEDIDGNGIVDIADFLQLNSAFGTECDGCPEDIDGNGIVDISDFLMLNSAFGQICD